MLEVGPRGFGSNLKNFISGFQKKQELSPRDFLNFLDSYAKPDKGTLRKRLGMGTRTERNESDLISMASKTKTINSGNVSITPRQQNCIASAIVNKTYGEPIPEKVAEKIAENLGIFTVHEDQSTVAGAILDGIFGNSIPENVAEKIAEKLGVLTNPDAQNLVAEAIERGIFGESIAPNVAEKIAEKLGVFTDCEAQKLVTWAIRDGKFGDPISENVAEKTAEKLGLFINPDAQKDVSVAIKYGKFGESISPNVAEKIAEKLGVFTEPEAQNLVAWAIRDGKFGNPIPENVAEKIVKNLGVFTEAEAQKDVASAIERGIFGELISSNVAEKIAEKLGVFTNPDAQRLLSTAILFGKFGESIPENVAEKIAEKLGVFTGCDAQKSVTSAILNRIFGESIPENVTEKIAEKLGVFTDPDAQRRVAWAIERGIFGDSIPENVAEKIAEKLGVFTDPEAQKAVARAILDGIFGNPIPENVAEKLISKTSLELFKLIHAHLTKDGSDSFDLKYNELERLEKEAFEFSDIKSPLGKKIIVVNDDTNSSGTITTETISSLINCNVSDCFEEAPYTMTVHEQGERKFLLTYEFKRNNDESIESERFEGWLSENPVFYKSTGSDVKIYDISEEYPLQVFIKDEHHNDFDKLPRFMQLAIKDVSFDISKYTHKEELGFIFGEGGLLETLQSTSKASDEKTELINKMKSIMQTCIAQEGDTVTIHSDPREDQAIKDLIDGLYSQLDQWEKIYKPKLAAFIADKDDLTKAKLAFLFGQLAKTGVLGYEDKANTLFYHLSYHCYLKLSPEFKEDNKMETLERDYTDGVCIEQISNSLLIDCGELNIGSIWD